MKISIFPQYQVAVALACSCLSLFVVSCSSNFDKIPPTDFIAHCEKNTNELAPFDALKGYDNPKQWNDRVNGMNGQKQYIYLAPVDFVHITDSTKKEVNAETLKELASYFNERLMYHMKEAEKKNPNFIVVDKKRKDAAVMELAIIDVQSTVAAAGVLRAGLNFLKGGGVAKRLLHKGHIAMAGKVKDSKGKVYMEFADYEEDHSSFLGIDAKDFQKFAHHKNNINQWSKDLAEMFSTPYEHKTRKKLMYFIPW